MATSALVSTIKCCANLNVMEKQKQVETTVVIEEAQKILFIESKPIIEKFEVVNNSVKIDGIVNVQVLYLDKDNVNNILDFKTNFFETIDCKDSNFKALVEANLVDINYKNVSETEIKIDTNVNLKVLAFIEEDQQIVNDSSLNLCTQSTTNYIQTLSAYKKFTIAESFEFELSKGSLKILDLSSTLLLNDVYASNNIAVLNYSITTNLLYELEDKTLLSKQIDSSYKYELDLENGASDDKVIANVNIKHDEIKASFEELNGSNVVKIDYPMYGTILSLKSKQVESIVDAYSITQDVNLVFNSCDNLLVQGNYNSSEKIDANLKIEKEYTSVEKVLAINGENVTVTKALTSEDTLNLEGIATANIVYQEYNQSTELKSINSALIEMPFSLKISCLGALEGDIVSCKPQIVNLDARIKRSTELDVIASVKSNITIFRKNTTSLLKSLELGEAKLQNEFGLSIYTIDKGKTFWDVAKNLSISQLTLEKQNPTLNLPSEKNEKVVVYRQRDFK